MPVQCVEQLRVTSIVEYRRDCSLAKKLRVPYQCELDRFTEFLIGRASRNKFVIFPVMSWIGFCQFPRWPRLPTAWGPEGQNVGCPRLVSSLRKVSLVGPCRHADA